MKMEHLANFTIAGFTYYEGALSFNKLKIGKQVVLKLEEDNKFDARAVAIYHQACKLGFVPKSDNRIIYKLLKMGMQDHLRALIQQVDSREHPESQVRIVVHLVNPNLQKEV
jgi:hypothetical protein